MTCVAYELDWLAKQLAEADDQSWPVLELREQDRYRAMARVAYELVSKLYDPEGVYDP